MDKNELFKQMILEFMLNRSKELESDRTAILNRISVHRLSADDYYDLMVNDIRQDYARYIFRQIGQLIDIFL